MKLNIDYIWGLMILILMLIFFMGLVIGLVQGFHKGIKAKQRVDKMFKCNPYYESPNGCQNKFINKTGIYCDGCLVCQNHYPKVVR